MPDKANVVIQAAGRLYSDTLNILKGAKNHMEVGRSFSRPARDLYSALATILKTTSDSMKEDGAMENGEEVEIIAKFLPPSYKFDGAKADLPRAAEKLFDDLKNLVVQTHSYMLDGNTVPGEILNTLCLVSEAMRKCYETIGTAPDPSIPEERAIGDAMAEFLPKKANVSK